MSCTISVYVRIKILTEAGRRYADVELPYDRARARLNIDSISGRTVHSDGTVIPFEGKTFQKTIEKGKGTKLLVKAFTLPDVQPGIIVDYRYGLCYEDNYAVQTRRLNPLKTFHLSHPDRSRTIAKANGPAQWKDLELSPSRRIPRHSHRPILLHRDHWFASQRPHLPQ